MGSVLLPFRPDGVVVLGVYLGVCLLLGAAGWLKRRAARRARAEARHAGKELDQAFDLREGHAGLGCCWYRVR